MRWLRRLAWTALSLIVLAFAVGWVYSRLALPKTSGEVTLSGAQGSIRIARDVHGIPSIEAQSAADLAFGLGVAHAQDRLWQLETHRRIGAGQLAEAFGEAAVANDRFLRALGVRRAAERQWARLQADTSAPAAEARAVLQAYARGVNSWVREGLRARPPEFLVLGLQPGEWTPVDSLAWSIMMAWDLGGNWTSELLRLRLSERLSVARIHELMPPYPGEPVPQTADFAELYRGLQLLPTTTRAEGPASRWWALGDAAPPSGIEGVGSNNWVLAGSQSSTGRPLLANDPHLKLSAPALWYFARLKAPGIEVAGASMPGLPMVVLGQNRHIAWGFTNTGPDVQDLYIEQIKPDDPTQYRTPQGWAAFEQAEDTIRVRGGAEVRITVRSTRHGPVISDAYDAAQRLGPGGGAPERHVLALRWTALDADAETLSVGLALNRADSVEAFIQAAKAGWRAPMQNMVVADNRGASGHIAVVLPGRIPVRRPENDLKGLAPAPGWDERYDWAGWLPPEALFTERDPARGWIATANQRTVPADWPHFLSSDWALPYRQQRIEALLQARPRHSLDDLRGMQADIRSLAVDSLLPYLQRAGSSHPLAAAAQAQLKGFDGVMAADRAAPLIYWAWYRHLVRALVADEIGPSFDQRAGNRTFRDAVEAMLAAGEPGAADTARAWWCDDKATPATPETCQARVDLAFTQALDELQQRFGADVAAWRWGAAHQARSEHRPFSSVKPLARFFELRTPVGGDTYTVNVSRVGLSADKTTGERYLDEHGPSLRALYDIAQPDNSRVMHSTGQSGLPWARHYRSFVKPWAEVKDVPLWGRGEEGGVMVVQPAGSPR
ncbi:MAG: penicillin acylase family protein [Rubrivivax sp.]|jgi:penicillin amidase|nr:penicillin acylase family protein [Rubrivivax sp.]